MRRSSGDGGGGDAGGGGGCSEGCWQHRLLSRCYIEWVDEYLRRSTSCGFFFNQANLPAPSFPILRATRLSLILLLLSLVFHLLKLWREVRAELFMRRGKVRESQEVRHSTRHGLGHTSPVIRSDVSGCRGMFLRAGNRFFTNLLS